MIFQEKFGSILIKSKDVLEKFKLFKQMIENAEGCKIQVLRWDNGGEFKSFWYVSQVGRDIQRAYTTLYTTPKWCGRIEKNRTFLWESEVHGIVKWVSSFPMDKGCQYSHLSDQYEPHKLK